MNALMKKLDLERGQAIDLLRRVLRDLEAHLDGDTLHADLNYRDHLCTCHSEDVMPAREFLKQMGLEPIRV